MVSSKSKGWPSKYRAWRHQDDASRGSSDDATEQLKDKSGEKPTYIGQRIVSEQSSADPWTNPQAEYNTNLGSPTHPQPVTSFDKKPSQLRTIVRFLLLRIIVALVLAAPIIAFRGNDLNVPLDAQGNPPIEYQNDTERVKKVTIFYVFIWLLATWLAACIANVFILLFPYLFKIVARFVNPAHQRYWRIFRFLKNPITLLGAAIGSYVAYSYVIFSNNYTPPFNPDPNTVYWSGIIADVLTMAVLWLCVYLIEKIGILYICIHYHTRSDQQRITHWKRMQGALSTLYEASIYMYPAHREPFTLEDSIISHSIGSGNDNPREGAVKFLQKLGFAATSISSTFGNFWNEDQKSHWFKPTSSYAVVERALDHPRSSAAIAKRMWMSLVAEGKDSLTVEDIAEVLGPFRREEAEECFRILDENENGDIYLNEMVLTVIETGRVRHSVLLGMNDINHTINTFDWIAFTAILLVMSFFLLILYLPVIKQIQQEAGFAVLGITFALGRTVHEFGAGAIFIFFKHPYDVGDRVEIFNMTGNIKISSVVTRVSILYTVFRRIDNGTLYQESNDRLSMQRIENVSRSNPNREAIVVNVAFNTTFKDLQYLQQELRGFLSAKENSRDFYPGFELRLEGIGDLNKLSLNCAFMHKSNWSNEELRAARSSKFLCALVAAIRKIPINKPGGGKTSLGDEGNPFYYVNIKDEEVPAKKEADKLKALQKRADYVDPEKAKKKKEGNAGSVAGGVEKASSLPDILSPGTEAPPIVEETEEQRAEREAAEKKVAEEAEMKAEKEGREVEEAAYHNMTLIPGLSPHSATGLDQRRRGGTAVNEIGVDEFGFVRRGSQGLRRKTNPTPGGSPFYPPPAR